MPGIYWRLDPKRLKLYPHFDAPMSVEAAESLANDKLRVARHKFYPFLQFERRWVRYSKKGVKGKAKCRKISYACRADSYIFAKYREDLKGPYEDFLDINGLNNSVLAYRNIKDPVTGAGKSNINFARDAIKAVKDYGDCYALTLDISDFFGTIDHVLLKSMWCRMLSVSRLPPDHFAVFRAITQFSYVNAQAAYERLGYFGPKRRLPNGNVVKGYLTPFRGMPKQICKGNEFREKIAGKDGKDSLIVSNKFPHGIPQGSTISDVLANMCLFDFDVEVQEAVTALGGTYFRYSDDLLIILPTDEAAVRALEHSICTSISRFGPALVIKPDKSTLHQFTKCGVGQTCRRLSGTSAANGLEYLGFRYDGRHVLIRDSTIANCRRKIVKAAHFAARGHVRNHMHYSAADIQAAINVPAFIERFGRVEDFHLVADNHKEWTFWTYAKRASKIFGADGTKILRQLRGYRRFCRQALMKAVQEEIASPTPRPVLIASGPPRTSANPPGPPVPPVSPTPT